MCIVKGWEYAVEATLGAWCPYERNYHISRRRRWVRKRVRDKDSKAMDKKRVSDTSQVSGKVTQFVFLLLASVRERKLLKKGGSTPGWPISRTTSPNTGWILPVVVDGSGNWSAAGLERELCSSK